MVETALRKGLYPPSGSANPADTPRGHNRGLPSSERAADAPALPRAEVYIRSPTHPPTCTARQFAGSSSDGCGPAPPLFGARPKGPIEICSTGFTHDPRSCTPETSNIPTHANSTNPLPLNFTKTMELRTMRLMVASMFCSWSCRCKASLRSSGRGRHGEADVPTMPQGTGTLK